MTHANAMMSIGEIRATCAGFARHYPKCLRLFPLAGQAILRFTKRFYPEA